MWEIAIRGDNDVIQELSKVFTGSEYSIEKRNGNYVLLSQQFENLDNYSLVKARALELLTVLNGGLVLISRPDARLSMEGVMERQENGRVIHYAEGTCTCTCSAHCTAVVMRADGTIEEAYATDPLPKWIRIAESDDHVARALLLVAHDFNTWYGLYKIGEVIEEGGCTLCRRGGPLRGDFQRLKRTAQSYKLLGVDARHASNKNDSSIKTPMPDPMTLEEAKSFILRLMQGWLNEKQNSIS